MIQEETELQVTKLVFENLPKKDTSFAERSLVRHIDSSIRRLVWINLTGIILGYAVNILIISLWRDISLIYLSHTVQLV